MYEHMFTILLFENILDEVSGTLLIRRFIVLNVSVVSSNTHNENLFVRIDGYVRLQIPLMETLLWGTKLPVVLHDYMDVLAIICQKQHRAAFCYLECLLEAPASN